MGTRKVGAAALAGLLYAQSLLGLVAVAALVGKNAGTWNAANEGYGVVREHVALAMTGAANPSETVWRE